MMRRMTGIACKIRRRAKLRIGGRDIGNYPADIQTQFLLSGGKKAVAVYRQQPDCVY
jgi:hypothetical protein